MNEELTLQDLKHLELNMLKYIDEICKKNHINYYLDSGTLLGAVRHKGFIPWDDDIDIVVDRNDYKKLLSLLSGENERYKVLSMYQNSNYPYLFAKLVDTDTELIENQFPMKEMGVFVDIFPLDHLPSNKIIRRYTQFYIKIMRKALRLRMYESIGVKAERIKDKITLLFVGNRDWKSIMYRIDSFLTQISKKESTIKVDIVATDNPYLDVPEKYFGEPVTIQFEANTFYAPRAYKEYLSLLYGNYMELPPESQRVTNHSFKAYMRENKRWKRK